MQGFNIALYAEMYGFPLTIYVLTAALGLDIPLIHSSGHLWATLLGYGRGGAVVEMALGLLLVLVGLLLVVKGWVRIWLVAVGLAPLIVAVAPCAVMCGLGLCMGRGGGKSCSTQSSAAGEDADASSSRSAVSSDIPAAPKTATYDPRPDAAADRVVEDDENQTAAPIRSERS